MVVMVLYTSTENHSPNVTTVNPRDGEGKARLGRCRRLFVRGSRKRLEDVLQREITITWSLLGMRWTGR
ncbi:hypothetical protein ACS0TY_033623 [Phlomoides rotata]